MSFFDLLNGLLTTLDVPFYEGQPELTDEDPPEVFLSYSVYYVPKLHGCGTELVTTYYVTVNIYTSGKDKQTTADNVSTALSALLTENGFVRRSGSFGLSNDFPKYYHRIVEFMYCYENS